MSTPKRPKGTEVSTVHPFDGYNTSLGREIGSSQSPHQEIVHLLEESENLAKAYFKTHEGSSKKFKSEWTLLTERFENSENETTTKVFVFGSHRRSKSSIYDD